MKFRHERGIRTQLHGTFDKGEDVFTCLSMNNVFIKSLSAFCVWSSNCCVSSEGHAHKNCSQNEAWQSCRIHVCKLVTVFVILMNAVERYGLCLLSVSFPQVARLPLLATESKRGRLPRLVGV